MTGEISFEGAVVLVVHAHPDDGVFATGAATIAAKWAGAPVHLRLFTGGEGRGSGSSDAGCRSTSEGETAGGVGARVGMVIRAPNERLTVFMDGDRVIAF